jgi:hypothetical protein
LESIQFSNEARLVLESTEAKDFAGSGIVESVLPRALNNLPNGVLERLVELSQAFLFDSKQYSEKQHCQKSFDAVHVIIGYE